MNLAPVDLIVLWPIRSVLKIIIPHEIEGGDIILLSLQNNYFRIRKFTFHTLNCVTHEESKIFTDKKPDKIKECARFINQNTSCHLCSRICISHLSSLFIFVIFLCFFSSRILNHLCYSAVEKQCFFQFSFGCEAMSTINIILSPKCLLL